jgi:hypothetical protein
MPHEGGGVPTVGWVHREYCGEARCKGGTLSRGRLSHQVPISIQMCSNTAVIVCIYAHVEIEIGAY